MTTMVRQMLGAFALVLSAATLAASQTPVGGAPGARGRSGPPGGLAGAIRSVREGLPGDIGQLPVRGQPFSGEGVTTTTQTLADGTRIERTVTAKLYRDGEGRVRREQTIVGLSPLNATGEAVAITIVDPVARVTYTLDAAAHS